MVFAPSFSLPGEALTEEDTCGTEKAKNFAQVTGLHLVLINELQMGKACETLEGGNLNLFFVCFQFSANACPIDIE